MRLRISCLALAIGAILFSASLARAENEGQEDLDAATEKKLSADSMNDLDEVINLCKKAIEKGLDATNKQFANNMLVGTLMQRASINMRMLVERPGAGRGQQRINGLADLERVLKIDPKMTQAYLLEAQLYMMGDRPQPADALKAGEKALEFAEDQSEEKVQALGIIADLSDSIAKKKDALDRALKIAPNNVPLLKAHSLIMFEQKDFKKALVDADTAIKNDNESAELRMLRGLILISLKKFDDSVAAFGDAIRLAPDSPAPYLQRARVYAFLKKNEEALADINHVLETDSDNAAALLGRAQLRQLKGSSDEALEDLNHVLANDARNVAALLMRAQLRQQKGDLAAAKADVEQALKDRPDATDALAMRGILAVGSGDYSQAINDFEKLSKIAPKNEQLLVQLAMLYALNKQPRKAVDRYTDALAVEPADFLALRGRADSYLNVGKHAEAATDYEAALKLKPQDSGVLNNLAWVLATSPDDGVRNGKRSVELGSKAAELTENKQAHILSTLAAGYAESGDFAKAREWSQKAVDLGSDDSETESQLKKELASYQENKPWREKQVIEENESGETVKPKTPNDAAVKHEPAAAPDKDTSAKKDPPTRTE